jgi:hypothetical protein
MARISKGNYTSRESLAHLKEIEALEEGESLLAHLGNLDYGNRTILDYISHQML